MHPIHSTSTGLAGFVHLDVEARRPDAGPGATLGRLEVPLGELRSGNPLIDRETRRRLDTKQHPSIVAELARLTELDDGRYGAEGKITAMGETSAVSGELTIAVGDDGRLTIEGEQEFDVRDWGVQPPKLLMLKVYPDVVVRVRLVARRVD